jgi:DNA invertase Pin-like site-specific DNA recombinase
VVKVLVDNNLSGSRYETEIREDYEEVLRLLAAGEANLLWTWENSRAQRNMEVFIQLRKILDRMGGFWAYDDRIYDMNDPDDRIAVTEDAVDAERESEKTRKRVRRGVADRAEDRLWAGPLSYGLRIVYDSRTGEADREIDPEQAPIAREIVERAIETGNLGVIVADLIERGVPCAREQRWRADHVRKLHEWSKDPERWAAFIESLSPEQQASVFDALALLREHSPSQVAQIMNKDEAASPFPGVWNVPKVRNIALNPALAGLRVFRGKIIGEGNWPTIITVQQHNEVMARLSDPARLSVRDGNRVRYLLSGILRCSICGKGTGPRKSGRPIYKCPVGHLTRDMARTDAFVEEVVLSRLESPDAVELFLIEQEATGLGSAMKEARELRARLAGFTDKAADGGLSPDGLERIEAKLLPKIEAAEARAQQARIAPVLAPVLGPQAREVWSTLPIEQKREVLRAIVRPSLLPARRSGGVGLDTEAIAFTWLGVPASVPDRVKPKQARAEDAAAAAA